MKKEIVKVQISLYNSDSIWPTCLVYNKDGSFSWEGEATEDLFLKMGSEYKKFFYARILGKDFELLEEAPWQTW